MYPKICTLGPVPVYSFGLMLALALLVCSYLLGRDARRVNIQASVVYDLVFWLVVGGILGSRVFHIILNYHFFLEYPREILMIQNGGLAWQGGLVFGCLAGLWYVKRKKLSVPLMLDLTAPYLALGQSIGRVGCFLNGCCYGREVSWGIFFPVHGAHLHPTQLYSSLGLGIIFLILKRYQVRQVLLSQGEARGRVFLLYLVLAPAWRFVVEFFRADHDSVVLGLSVYQWVCLGIIGGALVVKSRLQSRR